MNWLISQISESSPALTIYGPMGIVLCWFMFRAERVFIKIGDLAHRIDGLTKALLVDMIDREGPGKHTKEFAREAIARIDARAARDEKP